MNFARDIEANSISHRTWIKPTVVAMVSTRPEWESIKETSKDLTVQMVKLFDLNRMERNLILDAESLYFPWQKESQQIKICNEDKELEEILSSTGSWENMVAPTSDKGMIVTVANYISKELSENKSHQEIIDSILTRPKFLKHRSIRALNKENLQQIIEKSTEVAKIRMSGVKASA